MIAFLLFLFLTIPTFADCTEGNKAFAFYLAEPKDFSKNAFTIQIQAKNQEIYKATTEDIKKKFTEANLPEDRLRETLFRVSFEENFQDPEKRKLSQMEHIRGSIFLSPGSLSHQLEFSYTNSNSIPIGKHCLRLYLHENESQILDSTIVNIESNYGGTDQQPVIYQFSPYGGKIGDSIKIIGKNFGNDIL